MLLTIITPTLNRSRLLREALASVAAQPAIAIEHIVVDGGSTDGTEEMLREHPSVILLRDRGRGLYDAMNLGIERARGEVIGFLNSDDLYPPGGLAAVLDGFHNYPQAEIVSGAAELFDDNGPINRFSDPRDLGLDAHAALIGAAIPNARFFRSHVFRSIGFFPTSFSRVADREFLCRVLMANLSRAQIPDLVYRYRRHAGSLTLAEGANEGMAFRMELMRLAHTVIENPRATPELRSKARALEGRCRLRLATDALRERDILAALTQVTGLRPAAALLAGISDHLLSRASQRS